MRWRKPRPIQAVALVLSVLAAGSVLLAFNQMSGFMGRTKAEPQLIANIDLRLGNTLLAVEGGETQARADVEAGLLQLQTFDPENAQARVDAAKARQLKQRYGITWLHRTGTPTPASQAFVDAYNRVMQDEIERRHGKNVLAQVMPKDDKPTPGAPSP